jgi:hypothetical protein
MERQVTIRTPLRRNLFKLGEPLVDVRGWRYDRTGVYGAE